MKAMRREIEGTDVAAAPVVSEGGRSPSTLSTGLPGTPSYAFVGEPQTNGVIERLFRTLKEQIVYGRIFPTPSTTSETPSAPSPPATTPNG